MIVILWSLVASAAETRYVQASTLNLRAGPSATAKVLGRLAIGSPVTVLAATGAPPFVQVRVANGREGWVDATFLAATALTAPDALARAKSAKTPAERVSWAQRAAAIAPEAATLAALEEAYRAAGDAAAADQVAAERRWPHTIFPAAGPGLELEWAMVPGPEPRPQSGEVAVPLADVRQRTGLDPAAPWWVLPDRGPAVKVSLASAAESVLNECAGSWGLVLRFDGALPEGAVPIAFTHGAPPASWTTDPPAPAVPRDVATAAATAVATSRGWTEPAVSLVPFPDGWIVRVLHETPAASGDDEVYDFTQVNLRVDGAGTHVVKEWSATSYGGVVESTTRVARDVNGDGTVDLASRTGCSTTVSTLDGGPLAETEDRCCGC